MNQSTNYNFNIPVGTDLVNLLTQLIPNWTSLDSILRGVQDATFQNCTETVSVGVHAITRLDPNAKLLRWIATGNFTAGETFTIDGISTPAALPSGEALGTDAYITGAVVIAALNADESAMTVYVTSGAVAVAADSDRLGGQLPSYYATASDLIAVSNVANSASSAIALKNLVNTFYDTVSKKLYVVNADGTQGGEIKMGNAKLDYDNCVATPMVTGTNSYSVTADGEVWIACGVGLNQNFTLFINNKEVAISNLNSQSVYVGHFNVTTGDVVTWTGSVNSSSCKLYFAPYA